MRTRLNSLRCLCCDSLLLLVMRINVILKQKYKPHDHDKNYPKDKCVQSQDNDEDCGPREQNNRKACLSFPLIDNGLD